MPTSDDDADLSFVTTERIIAELHRRSLSYLLVLEVGVDAQHNTIGVFWSGGTLKALGACEYAQNYVAMRQMGLNEKG